MQKNEKIHGMSPAGNHPWLGMVYATYKNGDLGDCWWLFYPHYSPFQGSNFFSLYILYLKKHMHTSLKILDCQGPETWEHPGTQVWLGKGCDAGDDMSWSKSVLSKSSFGWFHLVGHSFIASFSASAHVRTGHIKLTDFGFAKYLKARCGAWRLLESWETRSDHLPEMAIKWPIEIDGFPIKTWWFSMAMLNNQMVSYWLILSWKQPH